MAIRWVGKHFLKYCSALPTSRTGAVYHASIPPQADGSAVTMVAGGNHLPFFQDDIDTSGKVLATPETDQVLLHSHRSNATPHLPCLNNQVPKKKDLLVKLAYIGSIVVGGIFQLVASFWCEARFAAYSSASLVLLHVSWTIMAFGLLVFYLRKV